MGEKKEYASSLELEKKLFPALYKKTRPENTPHHGTGIVNKIFKEI